MFTKQIKTQSGYMNISNAELTALDIVANEQKIGGLSRAAEILLELTETLTWDESKQNLLNYFSNATIQRLGYLLDFVDAHTHADDLYSLLKQKTNVMRKVPLKQDVDINTTTNNRWKIIENYRIDIDEI